MVPIYNEEELDRRLRGEMPTRVEYEEQEERIRPPEVKRARIIAEIQKPVIVPRSSIAPFVPVRPNDPNYHAPIKPMQAHLPAEQYCIPVQPIPPRNPDEFAVSQPDPMLQPPRKRVPVPEPKEVVIGPDMARVTRQRSAFIPEVPQYLYVFVSSSNIV